VDRHPELEEFEHFFVRMSSALVGQAYLLTGDLQESQDLAQETLLRTWNRWPYVSGYEDPAAWTRRVLHNLAVSRLRRRRLERRRAHSAPPPAQGPNADAVDLARALRRLPVAQRQALVLREVVGLTTEEVAKEMGASAGSVRKWLYRARSALAVDMSVHEAAVSSALHPTIKEAHGHG
jgi:RNA polymerase sigma-70 factor, ECF subfamily